MARDMHHLLISLPDDLYLRLLRLARENTVKGETYYGTIATHEHIGGIGATVTLTERSYRRAKNSDGSPRLRWVEYSRLSVL